MRKQRAEFKRALYEQDYEIVSIRDNDFILNKNGTLLAVELKKHEPLVETMARVQLNYEVMIRMNRQIEEHKRLRRLRELDN